MGITALSLKKPREALSTLALQAVRDAICLMLFEALGREEKSKFLKTHIFK